MATRGVIAIRLGLRWQQANGLLASQSRLLGARHVPICAMGSKVPCSTFRWVRHFSSNTAGSSSDGGDAENGDPPDPTTEYVVVEPEPEGRPHAISRVTVPENWPIVPVIAINRNPLFPGFMKKVTITNKGLRELLKRKMKLNQRYVGVFLKKDDTNVKEVVDSLSELYPIGSFAHVINYAEDNVDGASADIVLSAHRRIRLIEAVTDADESDRPKLNARRMSGRKKKPAPPAAPDPMFPINATETIEPLIEPDSGLILARTENFVHANFEFTLELKATIEATIRQIKEIANQMPMVGLQVNAVLQTQQRVVDNPVFLCDLVAALLQNATTEELQKIMEEPNIHSRLHLGLELLEKEIQWHKLSKDIQNEVHAKVSQQHRKYMLTEQLKSIKKELGLEKDDKETLTEKFQERLKDLKVPEHVMTVIKEEQTKISFLDPHSSEFSVSRNYLDWLTSIPWGKRTEENFDIARAKEVLDQDHYGMNDVKERILEFIAVGKMKKTVQGKILCFYGPPGVGKTSIARSIAKALNREYFRFSVGGMTDVAEIKGHRRTYVGAMPGKAIQCLKKVKSENPLILIDEVDKIGGSGYHGDPSSALLELLDPEQNQNFLDHFLDVPVDLSKVLFICTANVIDKIPGPLKDRMELIEVSGYVAKEMLNIAENYLVPQCRENTSLTEEQLVIHADAFEALIRHYCRESGVRNLQKHIEKIFRKAALKLASGDATPPITVDTSNLKDFVGRPKFTSDRLYLETPPGVIMGLAWTAMGGSVLFIESCITRRLKATGKDEKDDGRLEVTGHLGDVMKESTRTAYTVARSFLAKHFPDNTYLDRASIHVHVPEVFLLLSFTPNLSLTRSDLVWTIVPSAGCTITSALLSLALNTPARQDMAMTGEISLTGKVLPVGGIKEKIIAAQRVGVTLVILPEENRKDYTDLPDYITKGLEVHFVNHYEDVFDVVFPGLR
uniref:Lon protease homolog, mitochondrial n=1 Tax=Plectus sambesii TaxID=2011161 RepID=A0A914WW97_9BILA